MNLHMVKMFHGASSGLGGPPPTMILLAKRARWCCVRCSVGFGFSTLGASVHVGLCPGYPAISDGMSGAARMEVCRGSPSEKDRS